MLISVGTGYHPMTPERMPSTLAPAPVLAVIALRSLMEDCSWQDQTMLQFLGIALAVAHRQRGRRFS